MVEGKIYEEFFDDPLERKAYIKAHKKEERKKGHKFIVVSKSKIKYTNGEVAYTLKFKYSN